MPEGADAATELSREHAEIEQLVLRIATLKPGRERAELVRAAAARFLTHAEAEERYLLPAFRRYLPQGEREAADQKRHVDDLRTKVGDLDGGGGDGDGDGADSEEADRRQDPFVGGFVLDVQRHIERQETMLLPALRDSCPPEEINTIGRQVRFALHTERGGD